MEIREIAESEAGSSIYLLSSIDLSDTSAAPNFPGSPSALTLRKKEDEKRDRSIEVATRGSDTSGKPKQVRRRESRLFRFWTERFRDSSGR